MLQKHYGFIAFLFEILFENIVVFLYHFPLYLTRPILYIFTF